MRASWIPLPLRKASFRLLHALSDLRSRWRRGGVLTNPRQVTPDHASRPVDQLAAQENSIWLFVSTIGELNAIWGLLERLRSQLRDPPLTLLTDRAVYLDAYRQRFPQAHIEVISGTWREGQELVKRRPPSALIAAEIPCRLHDAPCRFSFAHLLAAKQSGALTVLVNGWCYGYAPSSMLDRAERMLFDRDYVRLWDLMLVQTEMTRDTLLDAGAADSDVVIVGNLKFDAVGSIRPPTVEPPLSRAMQLRRTEGQCPVIVAGSVTETADQRFVVEAFRAVLVEHPGALLVLAPRHPENKPRMDQLEAMLRESGLAWRRRTEATLGELGALSVLVLDTMGELNDCYRCASLAFVGTDHNVLEPLKWGTATFVSGIWTPSFPSYPVFRQMMDAEAISWHDDAQALGAVWVRHLRAGTDFELQRKKLRTLVASNMGATERHLNAMSKHERFAPRWQALCRHRH